MTENEATEPHANKVYTRTGDQGTTSLFGGARVVKDDPRLEAYGTLDELNSVIGILMSDLENEKWTGSSQMEVGRIHIELSEIQADLFVLGSHLATGGRDAADFEKNRSKLPALDPQAVADLEEAMDRMSTGLTPLRNFILPGGIRPASTAHLARTIARRAERAIVTAFSHEHPGSPTGEGWQLGVVGHVNRLNDYFFVLARHLNRLAGKDEPVWRPGT